MHAIRTIQKVEGPTLTVSLPPDFAATQVEVIVLPLDGMDANSPVPPELDPRYSRYILPKPALTEEQKEEFKRNPQGFLSQILRGEGSNPVRRRRLQTGTATAMASYSTQAVCVSVSLLLPSCLKLGF